MEIDWANVVSSIIVAVIFGFMVTVGGAFVWERRIRPALENTALNNVLNFRRGLDVVFVFPTRAPAVRRLLPQIAWEDARAIDYVRRALRGWVSSAVSMRSVDHFEQNNDLTKNLVIICSPRRNTVFAQLLAQLELVSPNKFPAGFKDGANAEDYRIVFEKFNSPSPSFEDEINNREHLVDYALLAKVCNPFNHRAKILIVAGIRAFGTWGAAKYLFEDVDDLFTKFGDRDFAMILKVTYSVSGWKIARKDPAGLSADLGYDL